MGVFNRTRHDRTELDELHGHVARIRADISRIETEWADTKDQVRRSYQRLERAAQRAAPHSPPPDPTNDIDQAAQERSDPYSKKLAQIRGQKDAIQSGVNESTG